MPVIKHYMKFKYPVVLRRARALNIYIVRWTEPFGDVTTVCRSPGNVLFDNPWVVKHTGQEIFILLTRRDDCRHVHIFPIKLVYKARRAIHVPFPHSSYWGCWLFFIYFRFDKVGFLPPKCTQRFFFSSFFLKNWFLLFWFR